MARRFIAGATPDEALQTVLKLRRGRLAFTADLLGEAVISEAEAEAYQQTCLDLLRGLSGPLAVAPEVPQIDRDDRGPIPRVNLSLKLTSLTARFDALHAEATTRRVAGRLRPILRTARELGAYVHVDMEQYAHKDLTLAIFRSVLSEPEFRDWPDVGIVAQAYLPETEADLRAPPRLGRAARHADHDPAGQGGVLGLRGRARPPTRLARAGLPAEVADRRLLRALRPVPDGAPRAAPPGPGEPQRPEPGARDGRRRGAGGARRRLRGPDAPRHGRADPARPGGRGQPGPASTPRTARCCRGWPTWSAGSWRTRRTSRS